jgi:hypothetical protein
MGFMRPETLRTQWVSFERRADSVTVPRADYETDASDDAIEESEGWRARLSAPGYLDCTEWGGVYPTEAEALRALAQDLDLCPYCLESECHPDGGDECVPALLDTLRGAIENARREALRGRLSLRLTTGETMAAQCARQVRETLATLAPGLETGDTDRAALARAARSGIAAAERAILCELKGFLSAFVSEVTGAALPRLPIGPGGATLGPADVRALARTASIRFPFVVGERR